MALKKILKPILNFFQYLSVKDKLVQMLDFILLLKSFSLSFFQKVLVELFRLNFELVELVVLLSVKVLLLKLLFSRIEIVGNKNTL